MLENVRLNGGLVDIDVDFMEREATPQLLMKLDIQLHLAGLSLSNTITILEVFALNGLVRPFTTGFTLIYSPKMDEARKTMYLFVLNCFSNASQKLQTSGSDHSPSHGIS